MLFLKLIENELIVTISNEINYDDKISKRYTTPDINTIIRTQKKRPYNNSTRSATALSKKQKLIESNQPKSEEENEQKKRTSIRKTKKINK